jgi:hypothetical protein
MDKTDKEEIVSDIITAVTNTIITAVDELAHATAKGFVQVHERIDKLEIKTEELQNDMNMNFAKVHQEIFIMKINSNLQ